MRPSSCRYTTSACAKYAISRGSSYRSHRGQQIILHHGPQERVGAEILRLPVCQVHQLFSRPGSRLPGKILTREKSWCT